MFLLLTSTRFQTDIPEGYTAFVTSGRSSYSAEELQTNSRMMGLPSSDDTALLMVAHPMSVPDNAPLHSKNAVGLTIAKTDLKQELGGKGKQGSER